MSYEHCCLPASDVVCFSRVQQLVAAVSACACFILQVAASSSMRECCYSFVVLLSVFFACLFLYFKNASQGSSFSGMRAVNQRYS